MDYQIFIDNNLDNICCICLDECIGVYNKNCDKNINDYFNFKCCNGFIHKRCLLLLFLNDFENCCLCRNELNVLDYYSIKDIQKLLHTNELEDHKEEICNLLYKLSFNKIVYYFYIFMFNIELMLNKFKYYLNICILDIKITFKEFFRI